MDGMRFALEKAGFKSSEKFVKDVDELYAKSVIIVEQNEILEKIKAIPHHSRSPVRLLTGRPMSITGRGRIMVNPDVSKNSISYSVLKLFYVADRQVMSSIVRELEKQGYKFKKQSISACVAVLCKALPDFFKKELIRNRAYRYILDHGDIPLDEMYDRFLVGSRLLRKARVKKPVVDLHRGVAELFKKNFGALVKDMGVSVKISGRIDVVFGFEK